MVVLHDGDMLFAANPASAAVDGKVTSEDPKTHRVSHEAGAFFGSSIGSSKKTPSWKFSAVSPAKPSVPRARARQETSRRGESGAFGVRLGVSGPPVG